jgi:hypothetical protein
MSKVDEVLDNLYEELMGARIDEYVNVLREGEPSRAIDVYRRAMGAFRKLSPDDQRAIIDFFRIITADVASALLGGIDGTRDIGRLDGDFSLEYAGENIGGDLQDGFMNRVESSGLLRKSS